MMKIKRDTELVDRIVWLHDGCFVNNCCYCTMSSASNWNVDFDLNEAFSDISDSDFLTTTQLLESSIGCSLQHCRNESAFSDISDDELVQASLTADVAQSSRFKDPVSADVLASIGNEKFAKRTIDQSTWAVTLFGKWRGDRNMRSMSDKSLVYLIWQFSGNLTVNVYNK